MGNSAPLPAANRVGVECVRALVVSGRSSTPGTVRLPWGWAVFFQPAPVDAVG